MHTETKDDYFHLYHPPGRIWHKVIFYSEYLGEGDVGHKPKLVPCWTMLDIGSLGSMWTILAFAKSPGMKPGDLVGHNLNQNWRSSAMLVNGLPFTQRQPKAKEDFMILWLYRYINPFCITINMMIGKSRELLLQYLRYFNGKTLHDVSEASSTENIFWKQKLRKRWPLIRVAA